ncbi:MAG: glycoside hydrolase family 5 protein [Planctomycetes bacterium]|nr:glycoside hydrolase family 5 protein [Planctomycetota bacterium]
MKASRKLLLTGILFLFPALFFGGCESMDDAFDQNRKIRRGVNIIGYDQIWSSFEQARFKEKHFKLLKQARFDSVRINLHPFKHMDKNKNFALSSHWLEVLDWAITNALKNNLAVILDLHEFNAMGDDPKGTKKLFLAFWNQLAELYKDAPAEVIFEILNEPCRGITPKLWNDYMRQALAIIRQSNPNRTVVIGPAHWNGIDHLDELKLPRNDRNIIATIHYYKPMNFTHQGASWAEPYKDKIGIKWLGTDKEKQNILSDFTKAQAWSKKHKRPLLLGEFGVFDKAQMDSRTRYLNFITQSAERYGWSWAYWQFDNDFILYDIDNDKWNQHIRDALIP